MPEMKGSRDERNHPGIYLTYLSGEVVDDYKEIGKRILSASMLLHGAPRYKNRTGKPEEIIAEAVKILSEYFPEHSEAFVQKTITMLKNKNMEVPKIAFKLDDDKHVVVTSQNVSA